MTDVCGACAWCHEPPDAEGFRPVYLSNAWMHRECFFRSIMGSVGHIEGRCSCYVRDGSAVDDPPGMTKRQAAMEAERAWYRRGSQGITPRKDPPC